jgi:hypothetical protein
MKAIDLELDAVSLHARLPVREHFDSDAGHRTALRELSVARCCLRNSNSAGCRGQNPSVNGHGSVVLVLHREDLAILAGPELIRIHSCKGARDGVLRQPTQAGRWGLHSPRVNGNGGNFYGTNLALPLLYHGPKSTNETEAHCHDLPARARPSRRARPGR